MKDFSKVLSIKNRVESSMLQMDGVHGISIGEEKIDGKGTGNFAIYLHVHPHMKGLVNLPNEVDNVKVIISYEEQLGPLTKVGFELGGSEDTSKYRPLRGGCQLQIKTGLTEHFGTLGCLVRDNKNGGKVIALSNQHVIRNEGQKVGQPKVCCGDEIGSTIRSVLSANVDGAVCSIGNTSYEATIIKIGKVNGSYTVTPTDILGGGYPVKKYGRTTKLSSGRITRLNFSGTRNDNWNFTNQLYIDGQFADSGDSGSAIVDDNGNVVGLLWGTGKNKQFASGSPIAQVMSELNISVLTASEAPALPEEERFVLNQTELLKKLEQETLKHPLAAYIYNLVTLHRSEVTQLINQNKKVATVWHRNNGPMILNQAIKFVQTREVVFSDLITEQGGRESIINISNSLQEFGSEELRVAIQKMEPYVYGFMEMTYSEILEELKAKTDFGNIPQPIPLSKITAPESGEAVINEASLNYLSHKFFLANKEYFNLEQVVPLTIAGEDYQYLIELKVDKAPSIELSPKTTEKICELGLNKLGLPLEQRAKMLEQMDFTAPENNLNACLNNADFTIYDYAGEKKGKEIGRLKIDIEVLGALGATANSLHLLPIDGKVKANGNTDALATLLLKVLLGAIEDRFSDYPLPHLDLFLGFGAGIEGAEIKAKEVKAKIALDYNVTSSGISMDRLVSPLEEGTDARVSLAVPQSALNFVGQHIIDLPNFKKTEEASGAGFGVRVGVFAGVDQPSIHIGDDFATASTQLGAKASVGVQVFGQWLDIALTPGLVTLNLMVQLKTANDGKTIVIKFIPNFDSITIDWGLKLPFPFSLATSAIQGILAKMLVAIVKTFSSEFAGIEIPLYTLNDSYETLNADFNVKFDSFGFRNKKAIAKVAAS
ncbi:hypothetical protein AAG747_13040 [Rapidithrix thailandica]|uniref:Uncharacterized protein n=1 Tax=Rapidithrix thailandica TaxID=413964 RepID=A0AAW9SAR4_9BACT